MVLKERKIKTCNELVPIKRYVILIFFFLFSGYIFSNTAKKFSGFWEGPHPEDVNKKFYILLNLDDDSISSTGFWVQNSFYRSSFQVEVISRRADSIRLYIPDWNCFYIGKFSDSCLITGGFSCPGELFDSVNLVKHNEIKQFLTEAKPGCSQEGYRYRYREPDARPGNIPTSRFKHLNDSIFVYSMIQEIIAGKYGRINSFLVVKNGKLMCEEYFYGYTANDLHQIESSTKSITSLLVGIAKDQGMILDLDEPLYRIFPSCQNLSTGDYSKITIAHLLLMTSGFSNEYEPWQNCNRIESALKRKLVVPVGKKFIYDGGNTEILGGILKSKTGMYADTFAEKFLFRPLGINKYNWNVFKQDCFPCMGGSLELMPRDMAKIGLLVLNNGKYENKQVVSEEWIKKSTTPKIKTHITGDDYAWHWWNITLNSGSFKYPVIWANGLGSQFIYIFPDLNVIIVTTGCNYENDSWAITEGIRKHIHLLASEQNNK